MKFGTVEGEEEYYYNFETNLLHTTSQYRHMIEMQLEGVCLDINARILRSCLTLSPKCAQ
jgi:hypothetical protein